MVKKIVYPQEIVVWNILPFIRSQIAHELKMMKIDQKRIAFLLGVTEPAISQYLNQKRAASIKISDNLKKEISFSAKVIIKDKENVINEVQRLTALPEIRNIICSIHKRDFGASKHCKLCEIGAK